MKILNLYAGIGGNRKLWGEEHEITAIEFKPEIANVYQEFFPNDNVIVGDAHKYLLEHFKEFDFIWSSPPCPTHSRIRTMQKVIVYPDMALYQEIILLKHFFKGKYVVENVIAYYDPLIPPTFILERHYFWANFSVPDFKKERNFVVTDVPKETLSDYHGFSLPEGTKDQRKLLRNAVYPPLGKHVLDYALINTATEKADRRHNGLFGTY